MKNYKNIIFDLGGVIINIDMARSYAAFGALAATGNVPEYSYEKQHQIFKYFEVGAITPAQFVQGMRELLNNKATDEEILIAWNAMLLDIPPARLELLLRLKEQYKTFLFSNTNAIHYHAFNQYVQQAFGKPSLDAYFHRNYYSHLMGLRKPDAASFMHILNENGLLAAETLFLDDTPGHLEGAKKLGIHTQLVEPHNGILEIFG